MRKLLRICFMTVSLSGCVSVQLPGGKITNAKDVVFTSPSSPFKEIKALSADRAWLSSSTGNTISYLSECGNTSEPSLQQLESESLSSISNLETLQSDEVSFNNRAARQTLAQGTVDGVPVKISLVVFKKNGCNYTLTYGGVGSKFSSELTLFEQFKSAFKAP